MRYAAWITAGLALLVLATTTLDRAPDRRDVQDVELTYFPSGEMLRVASLGFDGFAADLAFLRAVQYYGAHRQSDRQFPWAPHLFDVITRLDGRFQTPYVLGALILAEDLNRMDMAIGLLARGMEHLPESWELAFEAGFLYFAKGKDRAAAAAWLDRARRLPDAPPYVAKFAAQAFADSGSKDEALDIWREIEATAEEPGLREVARRKIEQLEG